MVCVRAGDITANETCDDNDLRVFRPWPLDPESMLVGYFSFSVPPPPGDSIGPLFLTSCLHIPLLTAPLFR